MMTPSQELAASSNIHFKKFAVYEALFINADDETKIIYINY
jgi:hypothetical protein